jgi:SAM-dependent methyltransferase
MSAAPRFTEAQWREYYDAMKGLPARETLVFALERFAAERMSPDARAVDVGCGEGRDAAEMLRRGWRVFAFDGQPEAIHRLLSRPDLPPDAPLEARVMSFEEVDWPPVNLVNASFSLPFCPPEAFPTLWGRMVASLLPGGRFAGQLFGNRDGWAGEKGMTHHTRVEVERLLAPFAVEHFVEDEHEGTTANGTPKRWHLFHIVARKE